MHHLKAQLEHRKCCFIDLFLNYMDLFSIRIIVVCVSRFILHSHDSVFAK